MIGYKFPKIIKIFEKLKKEICTMYLLNNRYALQQRNFDLMHFKADNPLTTFKNFGLFGYALRDINKQIN